jgi:hypothetical protein
MSAPYPVGQRVTAATTGARCPKCDSADLELREDVAGTVGLFRCLGHNENTLYARPYSMVFPVDTGYADGYPHPGVVPPPSRKPRDGEKCVCGRPAVTVWLLERGEVPTCERARKPVTR